MDTTKNLIPLHNDSTVAKLPPYLVMLVTEEKCYFVQRINRQYVNINKITNGQFLLLS